MSIRCSALIAEPRLPLNYMHAPRDHRHSREIFPAEFDQVWNYECVESSSIEVLKFKAGQCAFAGSGDKLTVLWIELHFYEGTLGGWP